MGLLGAVLLALGLTLVGTEASLQTGKTGISQKQWTYNVKCYDCAVINTFQCPTVRTCAYETRRCLTLSIRLNARELLVYKNCTDNCTFVYSSMEPVPTPKHLKPNSFYWVQCCNGMICNSGGPTNVERDISAREPIEEEIEGAVRLEGSGFFLSIASLLLGRTLT